MKKRNKQALSLILAILCLVSLFPVTALAADSLMAKISAASGAVGSSVDVTVSIDGNLGLSSFKGKISYDETLLTLNSITYNTDFGGQSVQPETLASPVTLTWLSPLKNVTHNGVLATLNFTLAAEAEDGAVSAITMTYDEDDIYNMAETNLPLTVENGSVTIYHGLPGDVNGDGKANNKDATRLLQYLAEWDVTIDEKAADCNGDGTVSLKDATRLLQYLTGWNVCMYYDGKLRIDGKDIEEDDDGSHTGVTDTYSGIVIANSSVDPTNLATRTMIGETSLGASNDTANEMKAFIYTTDGSVLGHYGTMYSYQKGVLTSFYFEDLSTTKTVAAADVATDIAWTNLIGAQTIVGLDPYASVRQVAVFCNGKMTSVNYTDITKTFLAAGDTLVFTTIDTTTYLVSVIKADTYEVGQVVDYKAATAKADGYIKLQLTNAANVKSTFSAQYNSISDVYAFTIPCTTAGVTTTVASINLYDGIKKNDFVYFDFYGDALPTLTKATTTVATITAFKNATVKTATVNGTATPISAYAAGLTVNVPDNTYVNGKQYTLVLDKAGAIVDATVYDVAAVATDYAVVLDCTVSDGTAASAANGYTAKPGYITYYLALADGTKAVYTYTATAYGTEKTEFMAAMGLTTDEQYNALTVQTSPYYVVGKVVKYTANETALTFIALAEVQTGSAITAKANTITGVTGYASANTAAVYWNSTDATYKVSAVKGYANFATASATVKCVVDDGIIIFAYVDKSAPVVSVKNYAYFTTEYTVETTAAGTVYGKTAYVDGVKTVLYTKDSTLATCAAGVYAYETTSDYVTAMTKTNVDATTVAFIDDTVVNLDIMRTYANAKVYDISELVFATTAELTTATMVRGDTVTFVYDANGVVTYAYITAHAAA